MYLGEFESLQNALGTLCTVLHDCPEVEVRGLKTKELHPCVLEIKNPLKRTLLCPFRGNNPFQSLAETMWVLAGRSDIEWLTPFMPRAGQFSDDDKLWRAGYGPRLRKYIGVDDQGNVVEVDQIKFVYDQMKKDPNTRQAVINIWDAAKENTVGQTKDYPCNDLLQFLSRDGRLDLHVYVRSNDVIWGFSSINVYEWTVLQETLAGLLGLEIGSLHYVVGSMHVYERHFKKLKKIADSKTSYDFGFPLVSLPQFKFFDDRPIYYDFDDYMGMFSRTTGIVEMFNKYEIEGKGAENWAVTPEYTYFEDVYKLLMGYLKLTAEGDDDFFNRCIKALPITDLTVACKWWYVKNYIDKKKTAMDVSVAMQNEKE